VLSSTLAVALLFAPEPGGVSWDAPPSCPDVAYLRGRIAAQLRGIETEQVEVRARVWAPSTPGAPWRLRLSIGEDAWRELEGPSCAALADAAAVMIAISLAAARDGVDRVPEPPVSPGGAEGAGDVDELGGGEEAGAVDELGGPEEVGAEEAGAAEDGAAEAAAAEAAAAELGTAETDAPEAPLAESTDPGASPPRSGPTADLAARPRLQAQLGIRGGAHGVGLPAPGGGLGGEAGMRWGPWSIALTGMHWLQRERAVVGDVAARYRLSTGGLEVCGTLELGRAPAAFELVGCGAGEAGALRAEGLRASPPRTQRHPWVALGGVMGAGWRPRPWVGVRVRVEVMAPLLGREFVIGDVSAGRVGPVDARGTLALVVRLPRKSTPR